MTTIIVVIIVVWFISVSIETTAKHKEGRVRCRKAQELYKLRYPDVSPVVDTIEDLDVTIDIDFKNMTMKTTSDYIHAHTTTHHYDHRLMFKEGKIVFLLTNRFMCSDGVDHYLVQNSVVLKTLNEILDPDVEYETREDDIAALQWSVRSDTYDEAFIYFVTEKYKQYILTASEYGQYEETIAELIRTGRLEETF